MSEKHKSASPSAIQLKNQQKTIGNKQKSDVIIGLEKGEGNVDICHNVRHSTICTIRDNADRITESAKCLGMINANNLKQGVFVKHNYHSPI